MLCSSSQPGFIMEDIGNNQKPNIFVPEAFAESPHLGTPGHCDRSSIKEHISLHVHLEFLILCTQQHVFLHQSDLLMSQPNPAKSSLEMSSHKRGDVIRENMLQQSCGVQRLNSWPCAIAYTVLLCLV